MYEIDEDSSVSISAYVTSPGYQTVVPSGYIYKYRNGEKWVAPFIPDLFYGASGSQLQSTWRQFLPNVGDQVILSRVGGNPHVPDQDLYWRKVKTTTEEKAKMEEPSVYGNWPNFLIASVVILGLLGGIAYVVSKAD